LATYIRHRPCFRALPRGQRALMLDVIVAALVAPLMLGIGEPPDRGLLALAALVPAIPLSSVVRPAHHERLHAVAARQREDIELVHPARMVENWTARSWTTTVGLVLARPSAGTRGLRFGDLGPHSFPPVANYPNAGRYTATSRTGVVPWSPVIPVEVVPCQAGADTWVAILDRYYPYELGITPFQVLSKVASQVLLPLAIGMAVRRFVPQIADLAARVVQYFFLASLAAAGGVALYLGAPVFLQVEPKVLLAVVLVVLGAELMGFFAAGPDLEARRTVAVASALGNPGLGLAVIAASYPNFKAAAFVMAYVVARKIALIPFEAWIKHRDVERSVRQRDGRL